MRASRIWLDLRHERLQTILEVDPGEPVGPALVVTELIEGVDLARLMSSRELSVIQKIDIVLQVCDALEFIHQRGIVHREVKPKNIVVSGEGMQVKLLDSGLARSTDSHETMLTRVGVMVGDVEFMAPEQAKGRPEQRSDIYGLGAVVYELMFNARFDGVHGESLWAKLSKVEFIPTRLAEAIYKALHPDLTQRFASAREFADSLRPLVPERLAPQKLASTVVTLHGIRTHASWQRAFAEVGSRAGFHCRLDRWNFGYFTIFQFLMPWSRQAKLNWFRGTYHDEFGDRATSPLSDEHPSIVAHSFGTYILGNALLRYPYLRFNKVILCGSILPEEFPWEVLIDRGQVQAVRNEFGSRDFWSHVAPWMVPGTGRSGVTGFTSTHTRLHQERFDFSHSEYFERGHMEERWLPFLRRQFSYITLRERNAERQRASMPIGLKILYAASLIVLGLLGFRLL
jgi:serine/threonine-protein kinase